MEFVFIVPDSPFLIDQKVFPFLGPLYLSAVLKKEGHEVEVVDLAGGLPYVSSLVDFLWEIPQLEADYIGITATTPQFPRAVEIRNIIKTRNPHQKVIIGGPHASANPDECRKYFDLVCVGEGERFIQAAASHNNFHVESFPYIDDLDDIPFPDWDAIDLSQYHYFIDGKRTMNILTSRGCPYACSFCSKAPWGQKIRFRSAENVIEEIGLLHIRGYEGLMLYDDEFFLNEKRDLQITLALGAAGMVWRCFSRADVIMRHTDLIKAAAACGLREVLIGCESGSNIILDNVNKGTKTWMNEEAIDFLKSLRVRVKAALIVGLPGETPDTIWATERFVEKVKPDSVDFTVLRVMPGSNIWKHPENYDLKFTPDYKPYKTKPGEYETGVSTSAMTAKEIVEARDYLDKKFNPHLWR